MLCIFPAGYSLKHVHTRIRVCCCTAVHFERALAHVRVYATRYSSTTQKSTCKSRPLPGLILGKRIPCVLPRRVEDCLKQNPPLPFLPLLLQLSREIPPGLVLIHRIRILPGNYLIDPASVCFVIKTSICFFVTISV